ncbi:ATP-binding cassette domain-containing protein [Albidovulum sp.]|uniref:ATP-binding cassette domain-containing protein n=1 Tax=Albidovulum sp. TaxID=1872424 RepID=UPI00354384C4
MAEMLSFDNVELYYDHVYALKGVSITMDEGETVALIGANGAGKSSILRAITGLRRIHSGEIRFMGEGSTAHGRPRSCARASPWSPRAAGLSLYE